MTRICITGSPKAGKSTLSHTFGLPTKHTDDFMHLGWSPCSEHCSYWFDEPGPFVAEGTAIARSLRKWLERNPGNAKPCDRLLVLWEPFQMLSRGQHSMAAGIETVLKEIMPELLRRGVVVEQRAKLGAA